MELPLSYIIGESHFEEVEKGLDEYISNIKKLKTQKWKYTIITPYSACVIEFNEREKKYFVQQYIVSQSKQLMTGNFRSYETDELTSEVLLESFIDLSNHWRSFPQASNFIDTVYESSEIFNAIRMIHIQAMRMTIPKYYIFDKTITNIFPACDYSEISFKPTEDDKKILVNAKVIRGIDSKNEYFEDSFEFEFKFGENNLDGLYQRFILMYYNYQVKKE